MQMSKETEYKIRQLFCDEKFQDFMFETIWGSATGKDKNIFYREIYSDDLKGIENKLIIFVKAHIQHYIPINSHAVVSFVLVNIVDTFCNKDSSYRNFKFYAFCNQLYYMIFHCTWKYFADPITSK